MWKKPFYRRLKNKDEAAIKALLLLQEKFMEETENFCSVMRDKEASVRDKIEVLYHTMVKLSFEEKLKNQAQKAEENSDFVKAAEYRQLYDLLLSLMDKIVMIFGEEKMAVKELAEIVDAVHKHFPDCTIILNVGDHTKAAYLHWMHLGAGAAMLSHDASNELQFKRLHSANMSLLRRKQGMWELQEMGYHTGTGFLVGTPYQTIENVSEDLLFMKQFMPQMIQIAPFLAAKHTPFERERGGNADMVLYLMAIARLMFRGSILIADPSLEQAMHDGRKKALQAGANAVVVDIVDEALRGAYAVYDEHTIHRQQETIKSFEQQIREKGYEVVRKAIM